MKNGIKQAIEFLRERYLLIEDEKTVECHTHLVIDAMEAYASQFRISLSSVISQSSDKNNVEEWIESFRLLFPKGYRGDKAGLLKKMITFCNKYPYTKEEIFKVTKNHINKFRGNYMYLQQCHYFISKDGVSNLAALCEVVKDVQDNQIERDINLGSTESI